VIRTVNILAILKNLIAYGYRAAAEVTIGRFGVIPKASLLRDFAGFSFRDGGKPLLNIIWPSESILTGGFDTTNGPVKPKGNILTGYGILPHERFKLCRGNTVNLLEQFLLCPLADWKSVHDFSI
jgi:hypothetical protein